jgi:hypothetical protein
MAHASGSSWVLLSFYGMYTGGEDVALYEFNQPSSRAVLIGRASQEHPWPGGLSAGGIKIGMAFLSNRVGYVDGYVTSPAGPELLSTRSAGRDWSLIQSVSGIDKTLRNYLALRVAGSTRNRLLPLFDPGSGAIKIEQSTHDGTHWKVRTQFTFPTGQTLAGLWWVGGEKWIAASSSDIYFLAGSGAMSKRVSIPVRLKKNSIRVACSRNGKCFLVSKTGLAVWSSSHEIWIALPEPP